MPQLPAVTIPDWKRPVSFVADAAQQLAEQGRTTTEDLVGRVGDLVGGLVRFVTAPALEELLDELNEHDERVRDTVREELQTFATAVGDGMFALAVPDPYGTPRRDNGPLDRDYFDDEIDLDYAAE